MQGLLYEHLGKRQRATVFEFGTDLALARARFALRSLRGSAVQEHHRAWGGTASAGAGGVAVPLRPHLGTGGVAPDEPGRFSSVPRRAGAATSTTGASGPGRRCTIRCWCGRCTLPAIRTWLRGTGRSGGTAIEASLNVMLQFMLHKDFPLRTQLLVTPTHWMVHAYHEDLNRRCTRPPWSCSTS